MKSKQISYFVERVIAENDKTLLVLFDFNDLQYNLHPSPILKYVDKNSEEILSEIHEGDYIIYDYYTNKFEKFLEIDKDQSNEIILSEINRNKNLRSMISKQISNRSKEEYNNVTKIKSYHVYVGHGNFSLISFFNENNLNVWLFDCSEFDIINKESYRKNIFNCFNKIKLDYDTSDIKINKVFITHPHYDHYNGIEHLLDNDYIHKNCEIYINYFYNWPNSKYNDLLEKLIDNNFQFVEPIKKNSTKEISFFYPEFRTIKKETHNESKMKTIDVIEANHASTLIKVTLNKKAMIFTGDLEIDLYSKFLGSYNLFRFAKYFNISHHGSITGHDTRIAIKNKIDKFILSGRDGTYNGIFSQEVINDFSKDKLVILSEFCENGFYDIDW